MTNSTSAARLSGLVNRTAARIVAEALRLRAQPHELPTMRLPWYEIQVWNSLSPNEGEDVPPTEADVYIFDEIGGSLGVSASGFVEEIKAIDGPINLHINSPGGSVFDALAIHSALLHHPHKITSYVDGIAASAASVVAMAGAEVVMMPGSQLMIHDASAPDDGNPEEKRNMATFLDRQSDNIADLYLRKAGGTADQWRAAMQDETWYFADEAVAAGLADRVWDTGAVPEDERLTRAFNLDNYRYRYNGRAAAPPPGNRPRVARASVRDRDRAPVSRDAAAQERARAFTSGAPVTMPDLSTRAQTRTEVVGWGDKRENINFPTTMRASLDTTKGKDLYHVHGYASVYDRAYQMWDSFGEYEEVVVHGAFAKTLASDPDVAFLVNHAGVTMARTTNGTLTLAHDALGLVTDAWLNPARSDVSDIIIAIDDEMVTEMSFAFMIPEGGGRWSEDFSRFEIRTADINRGDVSAVNYGASPWTSIASRAREVLTHAGDIPEGLKRALAAKLGTPVNRRVRQREVFSTNEIETRLLVEEIKPTREPVPVNQGRKLSLIEDLLKG
jgi:HK97 family phage prohead protease